MLMERTQGTGRSTAVSAGVVGSMVEGRKEATETAGVPPVLPGTPPALPHACSWCAITSYLPMRAQRCPGGPRGRRRCCRGGTHATQVRWAGASGGARAAGAGAPERLGSKREPCSGRGAVRHGCTSATLQGEPRRRRRSRRAACPWCRRGFHPVLTSFCLRPQPRRPASCLAGTQRAVSTLEQVGGTARPQCTCPAARLSHPSLYL